MTHSQPDARAQPDSRRERILEAATAEFAAKGQSAARIDSIARASGCNVQLIYYYFGNKAGLYEAVFERMVVDREHIWERERQLHGRELIQALIDNTDPTLPGNSQAAQDQWRRLTIWEGLEYAESGVVHAREARSRSWKTRVESVRRAQSDGLIDPRLDPAMVALLYATIALSLESMPQVAAMLTDLDAPSAELSQALSAFIHRLIDSSLK